MLFLSRITDFSVVPHYLLVLSCSCGKAYVRLGTRAVVKGVKGTTTTTYFSRGLPTSRVNHLGAWSVSRSLPISNFKQGFPPRWCESDGIFELELNPPPSHLPQMLYFSQANSRMLQFSSVGKDVDTYYVKHRMSGFHSFYLFSQFSLGRQAGQSGSRQSGIPQ